MPRHQNLISELESQLIESELDGSLSADPARRLETKKASDALRARLVVLRQENSDADPA